MLNFAFTEFYEVRIQHYAWPRFYALTPPPWPGYPSGCPGPLPLEEMMDDEIAGRIERLSPEARALFWEVVRGGEETEFRVPPDELVVDLHQRMAGLLLQDRVEFVDLFRAIKRQAHKEGLQLEVEAVQAEGFIKLIERTQALDRLAGRPIKQDMTLGEALARLEEAEDQ